MNNFYKIVGVIVFMQAILLPISAEATPIEYRIVFTPTYEHSVFTPRNLVGSFFVDDSILGPGFENLSYGPLDSEVSLLTNFTVTLNNGTLYNFDLAFTQAIVAPPISTVLATGSSGELIDIQGGLTIAGTFSQVILGREGNEGTYVDVQQTNATTAIPVSRGTYVVEQVSTIPIPPAIWLFGSGLLGLVGLARRRSHV